MVSDYRYMHLQLFLFYSFLPSPSWRSAVQPKQFVCVCVCVCVCVVCVCVCVHACT